MLTMNEDTPKCRKGEPYYEKESADELKTYSGEPIPDNHTLRSAEPETQLRMDNEVEIAGGTR